MAITAGQPAGWDNSSRMALADAKANRIPWAASRKQIRVGSAQMSVTISGDPGDSPPLLLLNGIGAESGTWRDAAQRLSGRQLIMPDMPGTGESPALPRFRRMSGYAELVTELLDELGVRTVDLLGYSGVGHWPSSSRIRHPHECAH